MTQQNMILKRDPETFCLNFDLTKDISKNLIREIEFFMKIIESWAKSIENKEIEQLYSKYRHGYNIHEQGKQKNEWTSWICS